jgi:hypothetical protein
MGRQIDLTFGQLRAMHEQITEMSVQSGILQESVGVARDAAKAAQDGANAANKSADAANRGVEIVISKERARIRIELGELRISTMDDKFWLGLVDVKVSNLGAMKAFPSNTQQAFFLSDSSDPQTTGFFGRLIENSVILPDQSVDKTPFCIFKVTAETIKQLNEQTVFMHVYGAIHYTDVFGDYVTPFRYIWQPTYAAITGEMLGKKIDTATDLYGGWEEARPRKR